MAGSISAAALTRTRLWGNRIGLNSDIIDIIFNDCVADGWAFDCTANQTTDERLKTLLAPRFKKFGFPDDVVDKFLAKMNAVSLAGEESDKTLEVAIFMPDLHNMDRYAADAMLKRIGLGGLGVVTETADRGTPHLINSISAQTVAANTPCYPGQTTAVTVQKGQTVPVCVDETYSDAKTALLAAGFAIAAVVVDETGTAGDVFSVTPAEGTFQDFGSGVTLEVIGVEVPDFTGNDEGEYTTELEALALVAGTVTTVHDDTVTEGDIISISPVEVGDFVIPETVVHMVVSGGPAYVPGP